MTGSSTRSSSYVGASAASKRTLAKPAVAAEGDAAAAQAAPMMAPWTGGLSRSDDQFNDGFDGWWGATLCASPSLLGPDILGMARKQQRPSAEELGRAPRRLHPSERKQNYALSPREAASNGAKMPWGSCGHGGCGEIGATPVHGATPDARREAYPVMAEA